MNIGTWIVQGIFNKMDDVISSLAQEQVDIACLSETKRKGQGNENRNNYVHFWSGVIKNILLLLSLLYHTLPAITSL